jgi:hypothetical protein
VDVITALQKDKDWLQLEVAAMRTAAQDAEKDIRKEIDRLKLDNLRSTSAASDIKRELDISASENVLLQASFSSSRLSSAPPPAAPPPPPLAAADATTAAATAAATAATTLTDNFSRYLKRSRGMVGRHRCASCSRTKRGFNSSLRPAT